MFVKILMLAIFFAITIAVGLVFRKRSTSVSGFVLGGRNIGPWLSAFAYGTSYFSAVVFVGYAGQFGWRFGISALWIGLGNAFIGCLLAWVVLARRTRLVTRHLNSATMPDFFGARYGSRGLKLGASVITFIFLVPYTASLYNGLSRLFSMAFNVDFTVCIIAMAALTAVYVIAGGYTATAVNDFIQGIIMLVGIIAVIAAVLRVNGGFTGSMEALARVTDEGVSTAPGVFASIFGPKPLDLLGVVLLTSVGTWGLPQMVQKFYSIKSEKNISTGTVVSTVFAVVISGGCYFLGGFGRLFDSPAMRSETGAMIYDAVIPEMLSGFTPLLIGIVIVLVLAASISTLSSLVMASASTFTLDFLNGIKKQSPGTSRESAFPVPAGTFNQTSARTAGGESDKTQLLVIRALVAVFIAVSAVIAVVQYKGGVSFIAQLMGVSWGALAGAFLAPFLYGLYWKRVTAAAVWVNFIFAALFMIANIFFRASFPAILQSPINAGAFTMLFGLILVPVVSLLTKKPDGALIEKCFECYNETVAVRSAESLGQTKGDA